VTVIQAYTDGALDVRYMDERVTRFGIRTINWIQDLDPNGLGSSFYL
jgi:beta-mannosidase